jgi:aminodeoxychorismate lyase
LKAYLDGEIIEEGAESGIALRDRGLLYGEGLFETLRVRDHGIEFLDAHLARLAASARDLGIPLPLSTNDLRAVLFEVSRVNGGGDLALRLTLTRGVGGTRLDRDDTTAPTILVTASALPEPSPRQAAGLRMVTASFPRNERSPLARHKTLCYLESVLARAQARRAQADEALLMNTSGRVAEAAAANVLLILEGTLVTPSIDEGALPGILRGAVLRAAVAAGLSIEERPVLPDELFRTPEVFLTNSLLGLAPVASLDGSPLPAPDASAKPWIPRLRIRVREAALEGGTAP